MKLGEAFAIILMEALGGPRYEARDARRLLAEFYERSPSADQCEAVARAGVEEIARAAGLDASAPTQELLEELELVVPLRRVALRNTGKTAG